jgi:hypothetical protein
MDGLSAKTETFTALTLQILLGGSVVPNAELNFWARLRRRKANELAWRRYILSKRLEALSRSPYDQSDREWDSRVGRYL